MSAGNLQKKVLVTGGSGYLASWIVKYLLEDGYTVHTTVRNKQKTAKYQHLLDIAKNAKGTLEVFEADLLKTGSFETAMQGCEVVMHTASPFFITNVKDGDAELVKPAQAGTRNVLGTVNQTPSVKRVVTTSSVVAINGDCADIKLTKNGVFTEADWNITSNSKHQPYPYSKTLAEKAAWEMVEAQNRWTLATINPGFILGPSLTKRTDSTSINFMIDLGKGTFRFGIPKVSTGVVDVRDVARAHILAMNNEKAEGRHILVSDMTDFLEIGQLLHKNFGKKYPFPSRQLPKFLVWAFGPFQGLTRAYVAKNVNIPIKYDNSKSIKSLGVQYLDKETTIREHFEQLLADGLVK